MPTYQDYQLLTVVTGIAGAALTGWMMVRTLRAGVARTRFVAVPRDKYPRAYRALVVFYGVGIAVLLFAAASAASLLLTGQY